MNSYLFPQKQLLFIPFQCLRTYERNELSLHTHFFCNVVRHQRIGDATLFYSFDYFFFLVQLFFLISKYINIKNFLNSYDFIYFFYCNSCNFLLFCVLIFQCVIPCCNLYCAQNSTTYHRLKTIKCLQFMQFIFHICIVFSFVDSSLVRSLGFLLKMH